MKPARETTGRFFLDEEVLRETSVSDFDVYAADPKHPLLPDLYLDA